ncbi:MAG: helix-turn-helix domain-containing protein [Candidatus Sumerlaeia bacterium]|nr:helix-turn-helix domain-containing protein [Candidatus Sumerlaeia bacterium]
MKHRQYSLPAHPDIESHIRIIEEQKLAPLLAPGRVARLLDLDRRRVYELVAVGELPAIRTGVRGIRIYRDGLIAWLRKGGSGPGYEA